MKTSTLKKITNIMVLAFIGWALCGATMGIGREVTSLETALIVHAIAAPLIFGVISLIYFKKFNYTTPMQTAVLFTAFVILMDFFIVALLIEKSFEMFASPIGTWIPFALIFLSTYLVGLMMTRKRREVAAI